MRSIIIFSTEPLPSPTDTWARGVLPVKHRSHTATQDEQAMQTQKAADALSSVSSGGQRKHAVSKSRAFPRAQRTASTMMVREESSDSNTSPAAMTPSAAATPVSASAVPSPAAGTLSTSSSSAKLANTSKPFAVEVCVCCPSFLCPNRC